MRKLFMALLAGVLLASAATTSARAGESHPCKGVTCMILQEGHVRSRIPIACVSIPFVKEGYGKVAMFIVRDFNPQGTPEEIEQQLDPENKQNVLLADSKITGPVDDFCRNPKYFVGAYWVVLCDEHHKGWITGGALQYAIRHGRPANNRRVHIGTHV